MERGLYIAATGMLSAMVRQDTIASNLANVNTAGYKADIVVNETFNDMFVTHMGSGLPLGQINFGTRVAATVTDFSQGPLRNTGNKLDVAIGGDAFFMVEDAGGAVRYTRNGQFSRTADGFLVTQRGDYVLDPDRQRIYVGPGDPVITVDGLIYDADGNLSAELGLMRLDIDGGQVTKLGDNLWGGPELGAPAPGSVALRQGFVEASGVNSIKAMIDMISTMRGYEASQRAMLAIDGTIDKAVNSVGRLG